jgi:hypothetical protein
MKRKRDKKGRFLPIHGGYSGQKKPSIQRYLTTVRRGLIFDLGGRDRISTAQWVLIDAVVNMLSVCRAIEDHVKDKIMSGDNLHPSLGNHYLAYRNSIRHHLTSLGIEMKDVYVPTLAEIIDNIEKDKKK